MNQRGIKKFLGLTIYSVFGLIDYYLNPHSLKQSDIAKDQDYNKIKAELLGNGFEVIDYEIDADDFRNWLNMANFPEYYSEGYGNIFTEKALEHYLSSKILELDVDDIFIDVAAATSPWYDLASQLYGCKSYAIDLHFPKDKDPRRIECNATATPFEEESITKMALHCAYETFENDNDMLLIKEADRILQQKGKMVIIPLYMGNCYYILSSPKTIRRGINYGKAKRAWRDDDYIERFSRHYSTQALKERVFKTLGSLKLKIYYFRNEQDVKIHQDDRIYVKLAALFYKS